MQGRSFLSSFGTAPIGWLAMTARRSRMSSTAGVAAALFLIHIVLLALPPLPPFVNGSLWDHVTGYLAVLLAVIAMRGRTDAIAAGWRRVSSGRRLAAGVGAAAGVLLFATALGLRSPALAERWAREEGVWEPLTLFCFLAGMSILRGAARRAPARVSRHLHFSSGLFAVLALEEIDYFGVFGGMIGRIDGVYTGSLHDVFNLIVAGLLTPAAAGLLLAAVLAVGLTLWRLDYLQPREWLRLAASVDMIWILAAALLFLTAMAFDARVPAFHQTLSLEEPFELAGAICLMAFALNRAAAVHGPPATEATGPRPDGGATVA